MKKEQKVAERVEKKARLAIERNEAQCMKLERAAEKRGRRRAGTRRNLSRRNSALEEAPPTTNFQQCHNAIVTKFNAKSAVL